MLNSLASERYWKFEKSDYKKFFYLFDVGHKTSLAVISRVLLASYELSFNFPSRAIAEKEPFFKTVLFTRVSEFQLNERYLYFSLAFNAIPRVTQT